MCVYVDKVYIVELYSVCNERVLKEGATFYHCRKYSGVCNCIFKTSAGTMHTCVLVWMLDMMLP